MRTSLVLVLLAACAACQRAQEAAPPGPARAPASAKAPVASPPPAPRPPAAPAEPARPEAAWLVLNADGTVQLAQYGEPPGACTLEARRAGRVAWMSSSCLARRGQPVFLGPDGETTVAVEPLVPRGGGPDGAGPVVTVSRRGAAVRAFRTDELLRGLRYQPSDAWLSAADAQEPPARLTDAGEAVRLATAPGTVVTLRFDGAGWPAARAAGSAAEEDATIYRWEDASGTLRFTERSEIPQDRLRTAQPVTAAVGVVAVERSTGGSAAPSEQARPASRPPAPGAPAASVGAPPEGAAAPPPAQRRSTYNVDSLNRIYHTNLDADAMDKRYEQQKKDMHCREVDGVVLCE